MRRRAVSPFQALTDFGDKCIAHQAASRLALILPLAVGSCRYSREHDTSISQLVSTYLRQLDSPSDRKLSPMVERLLGILPGDVSIEEYREHLEKKPARVQTHAPDVEIHGARIEEGTLTYF